MSTALQRLERESKGEEREQGRGERAHQFRQGTIHHFWAPQVDERAKMGSQPRIVKPCVVSEAEGEHLQLRERARVVLHVRRRGHRRLPAAGKELGTSGGGAAFNKILC